MSNDSPVLTTLTETASDVPVSAGHVENYVLLLVLLSIFAGGTLVLLSLLLLFCHRCCMSGRRYSRASDDLEKTNTTYADDSQPTQEITIRLDESDALSASSCHDGESERFVSTCSTGRRVSFNESALYEKEKTTQEKGRRYTLTEGDFHHLKKARLTHLHLPPAPCDLKILTIMECDSTESSTVNINEAPGPKLPLTIYQPADQRFPDWVGPSQTSGLPGDPHHSIILDQSPKQTLSGMKSKRSQTMAALGDRKDADGVRGESTLGQTSVLHFFSKLRRHASLEGAAPYFRKWKFDGDHRAASLDAKGSPKRRPFQRQRAASENTDHTEDDLSPLQDDVIDSFPQSPAQSVGLQSLSAETLSQSAAAPTSSVFLSRYRFLTVDLTPGQVGAGYADLPTVTALDLTNVDHLLTSACPRLDVTRIISSGLRDEPHRHPSKENMDNGMVIEMETEFQTGEARGPAETVRSSFERDDLFEPQEDTRQKTFESKPAAMETDHPRSDARGKCDTDEADELVLGAEARQRADSGSSFSFMLRQESSEAPPSLYREIWNLRASLEQYASSDQSSTDRESIRSDADSVSSVGTGARSGLDSCLSQDLDDEPDGDGEAVVGATRPTAGGDTEGGGGGGEGEPGNRKLLQMDSGYASIEAPSRMPEEMRLFGAPGAPRGKTASERRLFFTSSGRKGSVCESIEAKLFQEELEDEMTDGAKADEKEKALVLQEPYQLLKMNSQKPSEAHLMSPLIKAISLPSSPHRPRLRRRDYSIDEKTDALFNEFLRHDPRFDQQDSPHRARHRSRVHLRKQWQRHKQYSDPGSSSGGRYSPSLEKQRFTPLRRGDSASYPLDTRYHSTLSRIASAADEEASESASCEEAAAKESAEQDGAAEVDKTTPSESTHAKDSPRDDCQVTPNKDIKSTSSSPAKTHMDPKVDNKNNNSSQSLVAEAGSTLADKLAVSVEERLYGSLRQAGDEGDALQVLTVSQTDDFTPM
ncbi:voltage-dependent calcium channel beta subunit-associated regulatory protein [Neosynchiropus ocellatus]